jgi:hypothetical protein
MNVVKIIEELLIYYDKNRQVGHTYTLLCGAENNKCIFVVAYDAQKRNFRKNNDMLVLSLSDIENGYLKGLNLPLSLDHYALSLILSNINRKYIECDNILKEFKRILETRNE